TPGPYQHACLETQGSGNAEGRAVAAMHHHGVRAWSGDVSLLWSRHSNGAVDAPGTGALHVHDNHLIRDAGKYLAAEAVVAYGVRDGCNRGFEVQLAAVVAGRLVTWKLHAQIAQRLIRHLPDRARHHARAYQFAGFAIPARKDQASSFG